MFYMAGISSLCSEKPFTLVATWAQTWSSILIMMLMLPTRSHPLIYRDGTEWQSVETIAPGHSVGLRLQGMLHYERIIMD